MLPAFPKYSATSISPPGAMKPRTCRAEPICAPAQRDIRSRAVHLGRLVRPAPPCPRGIAVAAQSPAPGRSRAVRVGRPDRRPHRSRGVTTAGRSARRSAAGGVVLAGTTAPTSSGRGRRSRTRRRTSSSSGSPRWPTRAASRRLCCRIRYSLRGSRAAPGRRPCAAFPTSVRPATAALPPSAGACTSPGVAGNCRAATWTADWRRPRSRCAASPRRRPSGPARWSGCVRACAGLRRLHGRARSRRRRGSDAVP